METLCRKCEQKLVPDPFLILVNNPKQPMHVRSSFKIKMFEKRIIKKPYFLLNQVPFNGQKLSKTKGAWN